MKNKFILEKSDFVFATIDVTIVKWLIKKKKRYSFIEMTINELENYDLSIDECNIRDHVPVGTVQFIEMFYKRVYNIENEKSFEVPKILREYKYLKRDYDIVPFDSLPSRGRFFIKDASQVKTFSIFGNKNTILRKVEKSQLIIDTSHKFVCSEILRIVSEYRFYVVRGKIIQISFYKGKEFSNYDASEVKKIMDIIDKIAYFPKSYSFDIIVTTRGTALLEVHSYLGLGIHNYMISEDLLLGYIDSDDYITKYNLGFEGY